MTGCNSVGAKLPPHLPEVHGTTSSRGDNYNLTVSNGNGYLSHILLDSVWQVPPCLLFSIFTYPSNASLFRGKMQQESRGVEVRHFSRMSAFCTDSSFSVSLTLNACSNHKTDIKAVENRTVVSSGRGLKVVKVDQIGELRVLG
jgi:hypothetical protein